MALEVRIALELLLLAVLIVSMVSIYRQWRRALPHRRGPADQLAEADFQRMLEQHEMLERIEHRHKDDSNA